MIDADKAHPHTHEKLIVCIWSLELRIHTRRQYLRAHVDPVSNDANILGLTARTVVLPYPRVADRCALEVDAGEEVVLADAKTRLKRALSGHSRGGGIYSCSPSKSRVGQVGKIEENQRARGCCCCGIRCTIRSLGQIARGYSRKGKSIQSRMIRDRHLPSHARLEPDAKVAGTSDDAVVDKVDRAIRLGELAIVEDISGTAWLREQREVAQRVGSAGAGIVHVAEARHLAAVRGEAALAVVDGVGDGFGHAKGEGRAGEDVAAVGGAD